MNVVYKSDLNKYWFYIVKDKKDTGIGYYTVLELIYTLEYAENLITVYSSTLETAELNKTLHESTWEYVMGLLFKEIFKGATVMFNVRIDD